MGEFAVNGAFDTNCISRLPTALTTPPLKQAAMPTQEIVIWTPARAAAAALRGLADLSRVAAGDSRALRRT